MNKIDFHIHLGKSSSGSSYTLRDLIEIMDQNGIEKSGLSMLNGVVTSELNDKVCEAVGQHPDRLIGFAYINPRDPKAVDEVHHFLGEKGMKGVKFHSWKHGYFPDNNSNLDSVIDAIEQYNVPILTHTGTAPLSLPQQWAVIAERHPNQTFVFAHIGLLDYGYGCVQAVKDLPNVYVDTSGQVEVQILQMAFNELGEDRIIFATDWPYKYVPAEIIKLDCLNLTKEQEQKVFRENALKALNLK